LLKAILFYVFPLFTRESLITRRKSSGLSSFPMDLLPCPFFFSLPPPDPLLWAQSRLPSNTSPVFSTVFFYPRTFPRWFSLFLLFFGDRLSIFLLTLLDCTTAPHRPPLLLSATRVQSHAPKGPLFSSHCRTPKHSGPLSLRTLRLSWFFSEPGAIQARASKS